MASREPDLDSVLCLLAADIADAAAVAVEDHFAAVHGVRVVRDGRRRERRARIRRMHDRPRAGDDRRRVRNPNGRRVDDRRCALVPRSPASLPSALTPLRSRIEFVAAQPGEEQRVAKAESLRLVVRFQLGERDAFREIYERHFDGVYSYLLTALRDRHEAEDGAQEVFIRALRGLDRYEFRGSPFEAWLFRIARNHTLNVKRRAAPESPAEPSRIEHWRDGRDAGAGAAQTRATGDQNLLLFIERLPTSQRHVLILRYMVGLDWADIATVLDRSNGAVRQLEQRAFSYLRKRLESVELGAAARTRALPMARRTRTSPVSASRRGALLTGMRAA